MIARGASGGPSYFDNILVGIHSWVSAEPDFGVRGQDGIYPAAQGPEDVEFGWVGADVQVARYTDWIRQAAAGPLDPPPAVPAPPAAALLMTGVALLITRRRRRKCKKWARPNPIRMTAAWACWRNDRQ